MINDSINAITQRIIGAAIEVHKGLGPGLLESAYKVSLGHEMTLRGIAFKKEVEIPVLYKDVQIESAYRVDFIVEDSVILELKTVEKILPVHEAQLLTYLKLTGKNVGLLINFNVPILKQGIRRRIL